MKEVSKSTPLNVFYDIIITIVCLCLITSDERDERVRVITSHPPSPFLSYSVGGCVDEVGCYGLFVGWLVVIMVV